MAIQFNCPYCTASIRVPDAAAGKQGACPKCATKLIVPNVGPAGASSATSPPDSPAHAKSAPPPPRNPSPEAADSSPAPPVIAIDPGAVQEGPSMARVARQRRRKGANPLIPVGLFGIVLIALGYWMWKPDAPLEGKLTAERLEDFPIPPGLIDKAAFQLSTAATDETLQSMEEHPPAGVKIPDWYEMQFRPHEKGVDVSIQPTSATRVFRVKLSPRIRSSLSEHREELLRRQREEFQSAAKEFVRDWRAFREKDLPLAMDNYRNSLGFNRLTGVFGFCLVAKIGARSYRAVHEDDESRLYFLLPRKTEKFVITGRELSGGDVFFPGRFTVNVDNVESDETNEPEKPAKTEASVNSEAKTESPDQPVMFFTHDN